MKWSMLRSVYDGRGSPIGNRSDDAKNGIVRTGHRNNAMDDPSISIDGLSSGEGNVPHKSSSNNNSNNNCLDIEAGITISTSSQKSCDNSLVYSPTMNQCNETNDFPKLQHRRRFNSRVRIYNKSNPNDTDNEYDTSSFTGSNSSTGSTDSIPSLSNDNYSNGRVAPKDSTLVTASTSWLQQLLWLHQKLVQQLHRVTVSSLTTIRHALPKSLTATKRCIPPSLRPTSCTGMILPNFNNKACRHRDSTMNITFRKIHPTDKKQIQQLHEQWFPVKYLDEFYDDLVYERMTCTGDPLFTCVGTIPSFVSSVEDHDTTEAQLKSSSSSSPTTQPEPVIVACVVGCFIKATTLSGQLQKLLITNSQKHQRLFYIMTVGTTLRNQGIGTLLIEKCIQQVLQDKSCGVLYLHVLTTNFAAIQMYEQLGFHRAIEIPNYYTINCVRHNCYLYAKFYHGNRGHQVPSSNILQSSWCTVREYCTNLSGKWNDAMVKYFIPNTSYSTNDNNERMLNVGIA
jgi:histone acetyltransferase MCC1